MDYEKLVEQMKWWAEECDRTNFGCQAKKTLQEAATVLSTLQAENEKLREKVEDARLEGYAKGIGEMCAELEQAKRELDKAVKTIFQWTGCPECKRWNSTDEWCEKYDREADGCGGCDSPEWRGLEEG